MSVFYNIWKVWLRLNLPCIKGEKGYTAEISSATLVKDNRDIAEQLASDTDLNYNTLMYVITQYERTICEMINEGYSVETDNITLTPGITGEWNEKQLGFQPEKHKRVISCDPTKKMLQTLEFVGVEVMGTKDASSCISQIIDSKTGEVDTFLSRNGEIIIRGNSIKAIAADGSSENCIYLIKPDKTMIDIGGNNLLSNQPEEVVLHLPTGIEKGKYHLAIHTCFSGKNSTLLKQIRCIEFDKVLSVR